MQTLFSDFSPATKADWKKQLLKDLKGDSPESLVWENENGFQIKPFYTAEDLRTKYEPAYTHSDWQIAVQQQGLSSEEINKHFLEDLNRGASSISIDTKGLDFEVALKGIQLNFIKGVFYTDYEKAIELKAYLEKHYNLKDLNLCLLSDKFSSAEDLQNWNKVQQLFENYSGIKTLSADLLLYHQKQALPYYELALAFSMINEVLSEANPKNDNWKNKDIVIRTAVDSDFFMQIAKLRAYRRLWNILKKEFQLDNHLYLIVETSLNNAAVSDKHNNLLRTTLGSLSAVIGGCNELQVHGFDELLSENKELSRRMAINQQLILKHETYLDKMADISCGAYYLENLTDSLAEKALNTFKEFEKQGGYFKCLELKVFAKALTQQAEQKAKNIFTAKEIVVGVNKFRNEKEHLSVSKQKMEELETAAGHNPVLKYELEHFFKA